MSNTMTDIYIVGTQNIFAGQMKEFRHEYELFKQWFNVTTGILLADLITTDMLKRKWDF